MESNMNTRAASLQFLPTVIDFATVKRHSWLIPVPSPMRRVGRSAKREAKTISTLPSSVTSSPRYRSPLPRIQCTQVPLCTFLPYSLAYDLSSGSLTKTRAPK